MPVRPLLAVSLLPGLFTLTAACSGSDGATTGTPSSTESGGVSDGWEALSTGRAEDLPAVIDALDGELAASPDDGRASLYAATMRFWRFAENGPGNDLGALQTDATAILDHFEHAAEHEPDDDRIPAFSGLAHTLFGSLISDPARIERGEELLQEGIDRMPQYGHFLRALSTGSLPHDDPTFPSSLEHIEASATACGFEPDGEGGYRYLEGKQDPPFRVCNNEGLVPHVWEGFFTVWGDFALKGGLGVEKARALYATAQASPTHDSWRYVDELQRRIDEAPANEALYTDDDPGNDPAVWTLSGHVCTGCHQR